jgi:hypothetical protein
VSFLVQSLRCRRLEWASVRRSDAASTLKEKKGVRYGILHYASIRT